MSEDHDIDLRFSFVVDGEAFGELATRNEPGETGTRELITEEEIRDTYLSARFDTVQYGTYLGKPACLCVITFNFHASQPRSHRFRDARITLALKSVNSRKPPPPHILSFAPHGVLGALSTSSVTSGAALSASVNLGPTLAWTSVTPTLTRFTESTRGDRVILIGTERGGSPPTRVVWSVNENPDHPDGIIGIPSKIRTAVIIGTSEGTTNFTVAFDVRASVGWSIDPRRWPLKLNGKDDPILFDFSKPLLKTFQPLGPVFDQVALDSLTGFVVPTPN